MNINTRLTILLVAVLLLSLSVVTAQETRQRPNTDPLSAAGITSLTDEWIVQVAEGTNFEAMTRDAGYTFVEDMALDGFKLIRIDGSSAISRAEAATQRAQIEAMPGVINAEQVAFLDRETRNDVSTRNPYYSSQWHLINTGQSGGTAGEDVNILPVWLDGYFGTGINIGIVDDGVQYDHSDLSSNFDFSRSYDYNFNDAFPYPATGQGHGTSAAGVAAAENDSKCGVGSAYDANVSGQRLLGAAFNSTQEGNALGNNSATNVNLDISSNSWGPSDSGSVVSGPSAWTLSNIANRINNGRGGKGWIYVWAHGNGGNGDWGGADGLASSRYTVAVAASDHDGNRSSYSEGGAGIHVNAPSSGDGVGVVTTDRYGADGYNGLADLDCTNDFGGTSSATPLVSGIVALMLDANPNLTWRDVQHILVGTAEKNDPTDSSWITNGAGMPFSEYYGFGRVNAQAAVDAALTWPGLPNEFSVSSGFQTVNVTPPQTGAIQWRSYNFGNPSLNSLEHVELIINATTEYRGDMQVWLKSPSGTTVRMMNSRGSDSSTAGFTNWTFTATAFWNEDPAGIWQVGVADTFSIDQLTLQNYNIRLWGISTDAPIPGNLIKNPTFSASLSNWGLFGDLIYGFSNGAFQFYRQSPGWKIPSVFQSVNTTHQIDTPIQIQVDLANTSNVDRSVRLMYRTPSFSQQIKCGIIIPANTPLTTVTIEALTTEAWPSGSFSVSAYNQDGIGYIQVDNVVVRERPGHDINGFSCTGLPIPTNENLVRNPSFASALREWFVWGDYNHTISSGIMYIRRITGATRPAVLAQETGVHFNAGDGARLQFQAGNTTSSAQYVEFWVRDSVWAGWEFCFWTIPPNTPLTTVNWDFDADQAWPQAVIKIRMPTTTASSGYVMLDNITLQSIPSISSDSCYFASSSSEISLSSVGAPPYIQGEVGQFALSGGELGELGVASSDNPVPQVTDSMTLDDATIALDCDADGVFESDGLSCPVMSEAISAQVTYANGTVALANLNVEMMTAAEALAYLQEIAPESAPALADVATVLESGDAQAAFEAMFALSQESADPTVAAWMNRMAYAVGQ